MRTLVLMRGAPGCGKSTFIKQQGWEEYTLEPDRIRAQLWYEFTTNQNVDIRRTEGLVWDTLTYMLEKRMQKGMFTVIDATHMKSDSFNLYKPLLKKYRYRAFCIDLSGEVTKEECLKRNTQRPAWKRVPEYVIEKAFARIDDHIPSSYITVLKPHEIDKLNMPPICADNYDNIKIIGDIHSCATALKACLGEYSEKTLYIFSGDYFDRGIELAETINILKEYLEKPNVIFVEGNHEEHLRQYVRAMEHKGKYRVNDYLTIDDNTPFHEIWSRNVKVTDYARAVSNLRDDNKYSRMFHNDTEPYLDEHPEAAEFVKKLCSKLWQCALIEFHGKTFIITHGGIGAIPDNNCLYLLSTYQLIHGTGNYEDVNEVDAMFDMTMSEDIISVHGHRNPMWAPTKVGEHVYNLEADVGNGGYLRWLDISFNKEVIISEGEVENKIYNTERVQRASSVSYNINSVEDLVKAFRASKEYVKENVYNNISSFNFNEFAFEREFWDNITVKARGLFINTHTNEIVARAYDKFFNFNENNANGYYALGKNLKYPVTAYVKENGHIGLVGYNSENDSLIYATKSCIDSPMVTRFKTLLSQTADTRAIKDYIKTNAVTLVFEVIDMEEDPHIIKYDSTKLVLLDVVSNTLEFNKLDYASLCEVGKTLNLEVKKVYGVYNNNEELFKFIKDTDIDVANLTTEELTSSDNIEGVVLEDSNGYMFKLKFPYYRFWKYMRSIVAPTLNRGAISIQGRLINATAVEFYKYMQSVYNSLQNGEETSVSSFDYVRDNSRSLITLRDGYIKQRKENGNG